MGPSPPSTGPGAARCPAGRRGGGPQQGGGEAACVVGRPLGDQRTERWRTTGTLDGLPDRPGKQRRATLFVDVSAQGGEPPRGTLNGLRGHVEPGAKSCERGSVCVSFWAPCSARPSSEVYTLAREDFHFVAGSAAARCPAHILRSHLQR